MSWKFKITLIIPDLSQDMWTGSPRLKRPAASSSANLKKEKEEETNAEQSETHDTGTEEGAEEETPRTVDPCVDPDETTPKTAVSKKSSRPEGGKPSSSKQRKTHEKESTKDGPTGNTPPTVERRVRGKTTATAGEAAAPPAKDDDATQKAKPTVKAMPKLVAVKKSKSSLQLEASKPKKVKSTAAKSIPKPAAKSLAKPAAISQSAAPSRPSQTDDDTFDVMDETRLTS